jgi:bifunctional oligoribonuclease and PAP phosphatase NrnA
MHDVPNEPAPGDDDRRQGLDEIVAALSAADRIGVVGHVNPDGDALGSMIALAVAARESGRTGIASFSEPFVIPDELDFLDTSVLVPPDEFPGDLDVAVAVDTSVRHRVGSLAEPMEAASMLAVIDHHISDGTWGDVVVVDVSAAATTELVFDVIGRLGWPMTTAVATALYVGIVTDTGRFQYSSTSPRTHEITAALLRAGVVPDAIGQRLFEEAPFGYYELASRVLDRAVLDEDHAFVWSMMTPEDLDASGLEYHQADALIDLVRMARGTQVACLLKVKEPGVVKGSLRSRGAIDVAAIARTFGGGGHHNASGFTSHDPVDAIIEQVVAHLP